MANILYKKLIRQFSDDNGQTWINMDAYKIGDIIENPSDCEVNVRICRWVLSDNENDFVCDGVNKYKAEIEECSENDGLLWFPTGNKRPTTILIENNSCDCGYTEQKWNVIDGEYICGEDSFEKYEKERLQEGCGDIWHDVEPKQERKGDILECYSTDCGMSSNEIIIEVEDSDNVIVDGEEYSRIIKLAYDEEYYEYERYNIVDENKQVHFNLNEPYPYESLLVYDNSKKKFPCGIWHIRLEGWTNYTVGKKRLTNATKILKWMDTTYLTSYENMFDAHDDYKEINYLTYINTENINTINGLYFDRMFQNNIYLENVDVSHFNVENALSFNNMFYGCKKLKSIDISKWNPINITSIGGMFEGCRSLTEIDLSHWNPSKLGGVSNAFSDCTNLLKLNLSNWYNTNLTFCSNTFNHCCRLKELDLSGWNLTKGYYEQPNGGYNDIESLGGLGVLPSLEKFILNDCSNETINYILSVLDVNHSVDIISNTNFYDDTHNFVYISTSGRHSVNIETPIDLLDFFIENADGEVYQLIRMIDTSNIESFEQMFRGTSIDYIDTSLFDTSNGKYFRAMFANINSEINLDNLNLTNATSFSHMFTNCSCKKLDFSKVITPINEVYAPNMFEGCTSLISINFDNFKVKLDNIDYMFLDCSSLLELDLSNFDVSYVTGNMYYGKIFSTFSGCKNLRKIDLSNWDLSQLKSSYSNSMFDYCNSLETIVMLNCNEETVEFIRDSVKYSVLDTNVKNNVTIITDENILVESAIKPMSSRIINVSYDSLECPIEYRFNNYTRTIFYPDTDYEFDDVLVNCSSAFTSDILTSVNSLPDTCNVSDISYMFSGCTNLSSVDFNGCNFDRVIKTTDMFSNCGTSGSTLNISNWVFPHSCEFMFSRANYNTIKFNNVSTSSNTSLYKMFANNAENMIKEVDLSSFDTSNVTDMSDMFTNCPKLTSINTSNWNTRNVTTMRSMFNDCSGITALDVSSWDTSSVTDMAYMFSGCTNINSLDVSNWDTSNVTDMYAIFNSCKKLTELDVSNWDTSKVTRMAGVFTSCNRLKELDLSNWDTSNVTEIGSIFSYCTSLSSLNLGNWDLSHTGTSDMFNRCDELRDLVWNNFGSFYTGKYDIAELDLSASINLGVNNDDYPNARQHLTDTFVTNSIDRVANGYRTLKVKFNSATRLLFTEDEIDQMNAKGYTIS